MPRNDLVLWKKLVKETAIAKGVWRQFVAERERLKRMGQSGIEAWVGAAKIVDPEMADRVPAGAARIVKAVAEGVARKKAKGEPDSEFERARANSREVIQWVADYLGKGRCGRKWLCPTAKALSEWCDEHPQNKGEFWRTMFARLLPNRAQMEQEEAMGSDQMDGALAAIGEALRKDDGLLE